MRVSRSIRRSACIFLPLVIASLGWGADLPRFAGGTGEPNDPYQIATAEQLISIGADPNLLDKHFVLVADIDLDPRLPGGRVFDRAVIAHDPNDYWGYGFTGSLDGRGHVIRNLNIDAPEGESVGLFESVWSGATIRNLKLEQATITGKSSVGGLAGGLDSDATIESCHVIGSIVGIDEVGGLIGVAHGNIIACSSGGTVIGGRSIGGLAGGSYGSVKSSWSDGNVGGLNSVGGLVGGNGGEITSSYASGLVVGGDSVGGLAGYSGGWITCSYADGIVEGVDSVGGLVGDSSAGFISMCYSSSVVVGTGDACGGLAGNNSGGTYLSYWDVETSGQQTSGGGRGKALSEMKEGRTFRGWGHEGLWTLDEGRDYPRLAWEARAGAPIVDQPRTYGGGTGEPNDPYQIRSAEQLLTIGFYIADLDKSFILTADIEFDANDPQGIVPIGTAGLPFNGVFDGGGHAILNLKHPFPSDEYAGLFGYVGKSGTIVNLKLEDVAIQGASYVGGLAGYNEGSIQSCSVMGSVTASSEDGSYAGGLAGYNTGVVTSCRVAVSVGGADSVGGLLGANGGRVTSSYTTTVKTDALLPLYPLCGSPTWIRFPVTRGRAAGTAYVGGLVGQNFAGGVISSCYSPIETEGETYVGGLVGSNGGTVSSCYSSGKASGDQIVGGLIGSNSSLVSFCYASGAITGTYYGAGGLIGYNYGPVHLSYWDTEVSGIATSGRGIGKITSEMMMAGTFNGWGHEGQWTIDEGQDYPRLAWEEKPGAAIVDLPLTYGGGTGTSDDPYQIWNAEQLLAIGLYGVDLNKAFILMADIDLSPVDPNEIVPIGKLGSAFEGDFNGAGHAILNLRYPFASDSYVGLFGCVGASGTISDLALAGVDIRGASYVGAIAGSNNGTIESCSVTGSVSGSEYVGGLAGYNAAILGQPLETSPEETPQTQTLHSGVIARCTSTCDVQGGSHVGGLAGRSQEGVVSFSFTAGSMTGTADVGGVLGSNWGGLLYQCHSEATVTGSGYTYRPSSFPYSFRYLYAMGAVGGLVGQNSGTLVSCYATGSVTGTGAYVGGLVGRCASQWATIELLGRQTTVAWHGSVDDSYSSGSVTGIEATYSEDIFRTFWICNPGPVEHVASKVGGLVADIGSDGSVSDSFWDMQTSGLSTSAAGTGLTTADMKTSKSFLDAGWDFVGETANGAEDLWTICEGKDYPRLEWEGIVCGGQ
jgi:hypothetical protein